MIRLTRLLIPLSAIAVFAFIDRAVAEGDSTFRLRQSAIRAAVAEAAPSTVQIETLGGLERVGRMLVSNAPTTGTIVSADGYLVSSAFNFVQQPSSILVILSDGQRLPARIVARDRSRMLVLLKIDVDHELPVPTVAPRSSLQVGQTVIALGKTFDAAQTNLSVGILSATDRVWGKAIQTDAKISPANYGGPLIDLQGRQLGILVPLSPDSEGELAGADWYDSGIGFAVPLEDIMRKLPQWSTGEDLKSGKLGIALQDQDDLDPEPVIGVVKLKSPAAIAGIKTGDRIESIDGHPIQRFSQMRHALMPRYAGDEVAIVVRRAAETIDLKATLVAEIPAYEHAFLGILPKRMAVDESTLVRFVYPDSPAAAAGLAIGDRILKWKDELVISPAALRLAIANDEPNSKVTLQWQRGAETLTGEVTLANLPTQLLDSPPAAEDNAANDQINVGEIELSIPEIDNKCLAYVPDSIRQGHIPGLLVLLNPPGKSQAADDLASWKAVCDQKDLVLLVPTPADAERWNAREVSYIRKLIDQAKTRFGVDDQRVAIVGDGAGAAMAYLVAARNRDAIRGVAIRDGALPVPIEAFENEPLTRLAFLFLMTPRVDNHTKMVTEMRELASRKFPVTEYELSASDSSLGEPDREAIGRWLDCLDRL